MEFVADGPLDYEYSSASFYATGVSAYFPVTNVRTFEDIDLDKEM